MSSEFYPTAKGYLEATKIIALSPLSTDRQFMLHPPTHTLIGFSIELYLKAWLAWKGVSKNKLRFKYGHDLEMLRTKASNKGLPYPLLIDVILVTIAKRHGDYSYRYLEPGGRYEAFTFELIFQALDELDVIVDREVGFSASRGLEPGH